MVEHLFVLSFKLFVDFDALSVLQYVNQIFTSCDDLLRKKQFCYILARHVSIKIIT